MDDVTTRKLEAFREAVEILESWGYKSRLDDEYSGRAMYGKTVPAIVSDAPGAEVAAAIVEACESLDIERRSVIPKREDSMGLSRVYY